MAAEAYRVKADLSLARAIRKLDEDADGNTIYSKVGVSYVAGSVVYANEISPDTRERIENGQHPAQLLEEISAEEAREEREENAVAGQFSTFIPEHGQESRILKQYGHEVVPRDQVLEMQSEGADDAREALEEAKEDGRDERPNLDAPSTPDLAEASREGTTVIPDESDSGKTTSKKQARSRTRRRASGEPTGEEKKEAEQASS